VIEIFDRAGSRPSLPVGRPWAIVVGIAANPGAFRQEVIAVRSEGRQDQPARFMTAGNRSIIEKSGLRHCLPLPTKRVAMDGVGQKRGACHVNAGRPSRKASRPT